MKKLAVALAATVAFAAPLLSHAESAINTTNLANATAAANLDFRVTVPRVLYLRVGTGTANAANATKDLIDFTVPAANVGTGVAVWACAVATCSAATTSKAAGSMATAVGRWECRWFRTIISCKKALKRLGHSTITHDSQESTGSGHRRFSCASSQSGVSKTWGILLACLGLMGLAHA